MPRNSERSRGTIAQGLPVSRFLAITLLESGVEISSHCWSFSSVSTHETSTKTVWLLLRARSERSTPPNRILAPGFSIIHTPQRSTIRHMKGILRRRRGRFERPTGFRGKTTPRPLTGVRTPNSPINGSILISADRRRLPIVEADATYNVQYSDDGSAWTTASSGFDPGLLGWNSQSWSYVGAHRYWRLYLTNTPGPGAWLNELQFVAQSARSYTYDQLNRLATLSAPTDGCSGLSWAYDLWGIERTKPPRADHAASRI